MRLLLRLLFCGGWFLVGKPKGTSQILGVYFLTRPTPLTIAMEGTGHAFTGPNLVTLGHRLGARAGKSAEKGRRKNGKLLNTNALNCSCLLPQSLSWLKWYPLEAWLEGKLKETQVRSPICSHVLTNFGDHLVANTPPRCFCPS